VKFRSWHRDHGPLRSKDQSVFTVKEIVFFLISGEEYVWARCEAIERCEKLQSVAHIIVTKRLKISHFQNAVQF
jgi:hypothetical protein